MPPPDPPACPRRFIISALRRLWSRSPARSDVLKLARISRGLYRCALCKGEFGRKEIQIDHLHMVSMGADTWDIYIANLFCDASVLQALCKTCHAEKTKAERAAKKKPRPPK